MDKNNLKILIIRFRQMGDTIMATPLFDTLHASFPSAKIDLVLNERIAPLFEGHPSLHCIYTFTEEERHHIFTYLRKVWYIVHKMHYDVIIDMRSTVNTQIFALFSPFTPYRIGVRKSYTRLTSNYLIRACGRESMVMHNLAMAEPLSQIGLLLFHHRLTLPLSNQELFDMRDYLAKMGINFNSPIILMGVTAKLAFKVWKEERMINIIDRFLEKYTAAQLIFNYAPGKEEMNARRIYRKLKNNSRVFIDIKAESPRELYALSHYVDLYFGNEGGARHIVHAAGKPSFVICAPGSFKSTWIPSDEIPAEGVSAADITDVTNMSEEQQYDCITSDYVWEKLVLFMNHIFQEDRE